MCVPVCIYVCLCACYFLSKMKFSIKPWFFFVKMNIAGNIRFIFRELLYWILSWNMGLITQQNRCKPIHSELCAIKQYHVIKWARHLLHLNFFFFNPKAIYVLFWHCRPESNSIFRNTSQVYNSWAYMYHMLLYFNTTLGNDHKSQIPLVYFESQHKVLVRKFNPNLGRLFRGSICDGGLSKTP